jgi:hypothetical protein
MGTVSSGAAGPAQILQRAKAVGDTDMGMIGRIADQRARLWTAQEIAAATGGTASADFAVSGVTFDSREVGPGRAGASGCEVSVCAPEGVLVVA